MLLSNRIEEMIKFPIIHLEKITKPRFALLAFMTILFFDSYFLIFHKTGLISIDYLWIKDHFNLGQVILLVVAYSISISVLIPLLTIVLTISIGFITVYVKIKLNKESLYSKFQNFKKDGNGSFVHKDILRSFAISTNNIPAYQEYLRFMSDQKERKTNKYLYKLILFFGITGYFFSQENNPSILKFLEITVQNLPWYFSIFGSIIFYIAIIALFVYAFDKEDEEFEEYIYLPMVKIDGSNN